MIDVKRYARLKPEGFTRIIEKEDGKYLQFDRFDVEKGIKIEPEESKIVMEEISKAKTNLQKEIDAIDFFLGDIK
jgi:hypothetical protein